MKITESNGKFHWFSRGIGGTNAIDYLVKVRNFEFKEAVRHLVGDDVPNINYSTTQSQKQKSKRQEPELQKSDKPKDKGRFFVLPKAHKNNADVLKYLQNRGISENIITDCIKKGLLYQNTDKDCVFVGYDNQIAKYACKRSTNTTPELDYKKDITGSDKAFGFCLQPFSNIKDSNAEEVAGEKLYVFESPIDCLSHASIAQMGDGSWNGYRLALGGVSSLALNAFLENNPQITNLYLCLDNDKTGVEATERICKELLANEKYNHINIIIAYPPVNVGKDYNDVLVFMKNRQRLKENQKTQESQETQKTPKILEELQKTKKKGREVEL